MKTVEETHAIKQKHHRLVVQSYRAKADAKRTWQDKLADVLTNKFGTVGFLTLNLIWFIVWFILNSRLIPGLEPFDPYPYGFLTMVVSLEAIFLAIIVLISQNRAAKIAELREEIDLQINSIAESEVTKTIVLLGMLLEKNGIKMDDPELEDMTHPIRSKDIERILEKQLK